MRNGEWGNPDMQGIEQPTQPKNCGVMTDREIESARQRILESSAFADHLEARLENRTEHRNTEPTSTFTREEIGIIGYYVGLCDKDGLYGYMKILLKNDVEAIVRKLEE